MPNPFNLELIVNNVKTIVDNNRCAVCDKLNESRLRYPCGHTACTGCENDTENCILCLTPPQFGTKPVYDGVSTQLAVNASALLNECQDVFKIEVYRQCRISEQLKIEKTLFPKCIQAPNKYFNKKRASDGGNKSKRLSTLLFLEEDISSFKQSATDKNRRVEEWVAQSCTTTLSGHREPFSDLNVNNQSFKSSTPVKKRFDRVLRNVRESSVEKKKNPNRKRTHIETKHTSVINRLQLNKNIKFKKDFEQHVHQKKEKDESGIVIDDDIINLDQTQVHLIDKDKLACLAVIEASKHEGKSTDGSTDVQLENTKVLKKKCDLKYTLRSTCLPKFGNDNISHKNVPFYKRSGFTETCNNENKNNITFDGTVNHLDGLSITIESDSVIATVKLSDDKNNNNKYSMSVQTDITHAEESVDNVSITARGFAHQDVVANKILQISNSINENILMRRDIFADNIKNIDNLENFPEPTDESGIYDHTSGGQIVNWSSDSDVVPHSANQSSQYILTEAQVHQRPTRRATRRRTPDTSDSSEKENCDPNRNKKQKLGKKKKY